MRIGCMTTINEPMLGYWLTDLLPTGAELVVIVDQLALSDADLARFQQRTEGRLPAIPLHQFPSVAVHFVPSHNAPEMAALTRELKLDLLLNCGTPRIIKKMTLAAPRIGVLNCHPGELPWYRGCTVVEWALFNGDRIANTAHLMTEDVDRGPVVIIAPVDVATSDSYVDIRVKTYRANCQLMAKAVAMLMEDETATVPPTIEGKYWKPIDDEKLGQIMRSPLSATIRRWAAK